MKIEDAAREFVVKYVGEYSPHFNPMCLAFRGGARYVLDAMTNDKATADKIERLRNEVRHLKQLDVRRYAERRTVEENVALRARVAELEAAQAWRPIETAPRDGTWVLVRGYPACEDDYAWMHGPVHDTVVAQYTELRNGTKTKGHWQFAWYDGGYYGGVEDVTRWTPLPAPPKEGA